MLVYGKIGRISCIPLCLRLAVSHRFYFLQIRSHTGAGFSDAQSISFAVEGKAKGRHLIKETCFSLNHSIYHKLSSLGFSFETLPLYFGVGGFNSNEEKCFCETAIRCEDREMDHIAENCHNWTPNKDSDRPLTIGAKSYGEMHAKTRYLKQATSVQTLGPV